jgi:uncharacterized YigZ family protein
MSEKYSSIEQDSTTQIKVEGSRFIVDVSPASDETIAKQKLDEIKKKYFDATHHCYSYIIGATGHIVRYSDDGEPSGTAGIKIFNAIQSKKLSDILVVVTRYFGGTKLGVGGLGRAYYDSAEAGLAQTKIISKAEMREVKVLFPFPEMNPVMNIIQKHKIKIGETGYAEDRSLVTLMILPSQVASIETLIRNATKGTAEIQFGGLTTMVL